MIIEPNNVFGLLDRGHVQRISGRFNEALKDFNKALQIEPNNAFVFRQRGDIYRQIDRFNEALQDFDKALQIEPDNAYVLSRKGADQQQCKFEETLEVIKHCK